jgi:hypothetical protein
VAVGDVEAIAAGVDDGDVGDAQRGTAAAGGEELEAAAGGVEAEDRFVGEVAGVEPALPVEGQAEGEAAGRGDDLEGRAVGGDAVDLAEFAAAPDVAVAVDGDPFRVEEAGLAEGAVVEDGGAGEGEDWVHGGGPWM